MTFSTPDGRDFHLPEDITLGELEAFDEEVYQDRPAAHDKCLTYRRLMAEGAKIKPDQIPDERDLLENARFNAVILAWFAKCDVQDVYQIHPVDVEVAIGMVIDMLYRNYTPYDKEAGIVINGTAHHFKEIYGLNYGELTDIQQVRYTRSQSSPFGGYATCLSILYFGGQKMKGAELGEEVAKQEAVKYWADLPLSVVNGLVFFWTQTSLTSLTDSLESMGKYAVQSLSSLAEKH
jgi:hypothetical protein